MKKITLFFLFIFMSFVLFSLILFSDAGKQLYNIYENTVLSGHYEGETKAQYYFSFLLKICLPVCLAISAVISLGISRFKK